MKSLDLLLSVSRVDWKGSMRTIRIDFGKSSENYVRPGHGTLRERQDTQSTEPVNTTASEAASRTVSFPVPPSSTPSATTAHRDLSFSYIGTPLLPPSFPGVDSASLNAPFVPQGYSVQCKNCTVTGSIDILQGSVSGNATSQNQQNDIFRFNEGNITFEANGFFAHIELGANIQPSTGLLSFEAPMPSIGIPGFQVSGLRRS
ncbi:MAG: hypothetical protein Q9202_000676, partial [Teloschistes flavicans]